VQSPRRIVRSDDVRSDFKADLANELDAAVAARLFRVQWNFIRHRTPGSQNPRVRVLLRLAGHVGAPRGEAQVEGCHWVLD